jgi:transcriptional regulator with XRE-family HTH domain
MSTGEKIIKLRQKKGLSQEQFGELLGVSRQAVSKWETGQTMPDIDKIISMSQIFEVTTDYLLMDENKTAANSPTQNKEQPSTSQYNSPQFNPFKFEYKSKSTLWGLPLVHIKAGHAKGIFAIGLRATGLFSLGFLSMGLFSFGLLSLGLIAFGVLAIGALAMGSISCGILALGGVAFGIFSLGAVSIGMYSMGGCAIASKIAFGGYADGFIAIGDEVRGEYTWHIEQGLTPEIKEEIYQTILRELPNTPKFILNLFK